jgi:hypothetical protein
MVIERFITMVIDKSIAFLDIDSLEFSPCDKIRESKFSQLSFRERVMPLSPILNNIYSYILNNNHPFIFSTCCSGRALLVNEMPKVLHIPAQDHKAEWKKKVDNYSFFFVEKAITDHTQNNFIDDIYSKFKQNNNLFSFIQSLDAHEWVVFGNGAAFCVYPAICCLLNAGQKVTVLSDVLIDSATGYTTEPPAYLRNVMLEECANRGATVCTIKTFCKLKCIQFGYVQKDSLLVGEVC